MNLYKDAAPLSPHKVHLCITNPKIMAEASEK
jgi:hypothetical protein